MAEQDTKWADIQVRQDVTVWTGYQGQGGIVQYIDADKIIVTSPLANFVFPRETVTRITVDLPLPADECLEYSDECSGPVEYWHSGGINGRSWPRCTFHGNRRLDRHENSMEKYADSDVVPSWFDPSYAGEEW
jgi:hypothetical protein